jgi:Tetracyclin repressor-like, C-terminal domain
MASAWRCRDGPTRAAIARGELPADVDANLIIETLIGPLYVRLLFTGEPIDDRIADQVARIVTAGAASAHN